MAIVGGSHFLDDLRQRLGITKPVRNLVIRVPFDGIATIEVEYPMEDGQAKAVVETFAVLSIDSLKQYESMKENDHGMR